MQCPIRSLPEWLTARACRAGEDYLLAIAAEKFQGEAERAGQRVLKDFRTGALGRFALELPPGP